MSPACLSARLSARLPTCQVKQAQVKISSQTGSWLEMAMAEPSVNCFGTCQTPRCLNSITIRRIKTKRQPDLSADHEKESKTKKKIEEIKKKQKKDKNKPKTKEQL